MRCALLTAAFLAIALAEANAQTRPHFTPEKATLACKAKVGQQIAQQYGVSASPSKPFDISETEEGWRIEGIYTTDEAEQRRIDVACEVSGDGIGVTLSLSEKASDSTSPGNAIADTAERMPAPSNAPTPPPATAKPMSQSSKPRPRPLTAAPSPPVPPQLQALRDVREMLLQTLREGGDVQKIEAAIERIDAALGEH